MTQDERFKDYRKDIENLISKIRGVICARIIFDDDGEILEVHILGDASRGPKQIVRDIESAVVAAFGVRIDHKKISVAQINNDSQNVSPIDISKLRLKNFQVNITSKQMETHVILEYDDSSFEGRASGLISEKNRMRLVALATLSAIESFLDKSSIFILEDIGIMNIGLEEASFSLITIVSEKGPKASIGVSLVSGSIEEAVALSTIDAAIKYIYDLYKF